MTHCVCMSSSDIAAAAQNLNIQLRVLANTRTAAWARPCDIRECREAVSFARARLAIAQAAAGGPSLRKAELSDDVRSCAAELLISEVAS